MICNVLSALMALSSSLATLSVDESGIVSVPQVEREREQQLLNLLDELELYYRQESQDVLRLRELCDRILSSSEHLLPSIRFDIELERAGTYAAELSEASMQYVIDTYLALAEEFREQDAARAAEALVRAATVRASAGLFKEAETVLLEAQQLLGGSEALSPDEYERRERLGQKIAFWLRQVRQQHASTDKNELAAGTVGNGVAHDEESSQIDPAATVTPLEQARQASMEQAANGDIGAGAAVAPSGGRGERAAVDDVYLAAIMIILGATLAVVLVVLRRKCFGTRQAVLPRRGDAGP